MIHADKPKWIVDGDPINQFGLLTLIFRFSFLQLMCMRPFRSVFSCAYPQVVSDAETDSYDQS